MGESQWLPQFTNEMIVNAHARSNNLLDSYLIALEGWRRGLTLTWYSQKVKRNRVHAPGRLFTLSSENHTHEFYKAQGDKVSAESLKITGNKDRAKKRFSEYGIPVPEGKRFFRDDSDERIIDYAQELGFPIVLKPTNGYQGKGVISNIKNINQLRESLPYVRKTLNYPDVLIEQYIPGEEYRVFVVEDQVIYAINRIPANIVGDGINTVRQLIEMKNKERRKNPRLYTCLIKIDFEVKSLIERSGYSLESVLEKGKRLYLRGNSNISTGGDSVDMLDELSDDVKEIAIDSLKAMPNLPHAGVDIIVSSNKDLSYLAYVLEINAIPQIGSSVFPMIGKSRDVPSAIVDYYFPETKGKENYNPQVYFDLRSVLNPLMSKTAEEVTVTPAPIGPTYAVKYTIEGQVQGVGYRRWIRKKALEVDLYGYTQNLNNGKVNVVVAGERSKVEDFKEICMMGSKKAQVSNVKGKLWDKPVKVGFEIKNNPKKKKNPQKNPQKNTLWRKVKNRLTMFRKK